MLYRVLSDPAISVLVVEHRDRLVRFGVEHLQTGLAVSGPRLVVLDPEESASDLVGDISEVLTWMCAWLYGQRAAKGRAARAIAVAAGLTAG
jgi:putative resolvase